MTNEADLEVLRATMTEPGMSAEEQIERRADFLVRELDEFMALAANNETVDLIEGQQLSIGQMNTRVQLILSFLAARKPRLTVVRNNG